MADAARRMFDVAFATIILIAGAPLLLFAIALIRLESPGPSIFRQTRMGKGGENFTIYKLRGMFVDAPERFPDLYAYGPGDVSDKNYGYVFHTGVDPRVTRIGRVLRKFSIDELPNFVNVIRGDMSVVGPRPEIPDVAHLYDGDLTTVLSVRPGVTSPAKAGGRDGLSFEETLQADLDYVHNRSFWLDVKTICRTAVGAIYGRNAS